MSTSERTAVVTGAAIRIGRAIAEMLIADGFHVVVHYGQSGTAARELADSHPDDITLVQANLNDPCGAVAQIMSVLADAGRSADVLVNSAAIFEEGGWQETTEDQWDRHFNINLKAAFFLSQAFAAALPQDMSGHIINVVDWRGGRPRADHLAYTLTKSALLAMTRALAQDMAPRIQVNGVAPGAILPPPGLPTEYLERRIGEIPLRRHGNPHDIARSVQFLVGSPFITGEIIHVTGGEQL